MNWKIFTAACVSACMISFPQNIIGCGPDIDPYDYYTSFFYQQIVSGHNFKPFYYSGYTFLYDENEPVSPADVLANEWAGYAGVPVTDKDAKAFVNDYSWKDINNLYYNIEKSQPLKIPDSVKRNSMTNYFAQQKDMEALGYILYAKQVQPYVTGEYDQWEPIKRDSLKMAKLIKNGQQLYAASKKDVFKLKYGYQIVRLAHYSGQYEAALKYYEDYIAQNSTASVLQPMSLSLKAGALYRTGHQKEAAYLFSKVFMENDVKRISNYLSFFWSVDRTTNREEYTSLCKNDAERAGMLSLFALGSAADETATISNVYQLQPKLPVLEVLVTREINKLEENYFTPLLKKQKGGREFYYTWRDAGTDSVLQEGAQRAKSLADLCAAIAKKGNSSNDGLFQTAAAYISYMILDYKKADEYLAAAKKMKLTQAVEDQWELTNMLVAINKNDKIDDAFEAQILPSIRWLQKKAKEEKPSKAGYYDVSPWQKFYRNLMSEILAKRYHAQGELYKEVLAIGNADNITYGNGEFSNYNSLDYLRNKLVSSDVEKLYALMTAKNNSAYVTYLINNSSLKTADVVDFAGTAYLRDRHYEKAIAWFNKSSSSVKKYTVDRNAFIELLYDQEEKLPGEKGSITKLAFAQEMLRLKKITETDKVAAAKSWYKMALGLYNTTYYGHAWQLVQYGRSGSDGYYIPDGASDFEKEYYGCAVAQEYFKKAMDASADKNFKAKCLFMMAKCDQKTLRQPQYSDFGYDKYDQMEAANNLYFGKFKNNRLFPQFVKEYSGTPFYEEALTSCSYLRDFISKK